MATMLRDGGDLDSVDRSLLDCELGHDRAFKIPPFGVKADILSLDPGAPSLMSGVSDGVSLHSVSRLRCLPPDSAPPPAPNNVRAMATKLVRIVSPHTSSRHHHPATRGPGNTDVNGPSRSFTKPGEGPYSRSYYDLFYISFVEYCCFFGAFLYVFLSKCH